MRLLKNAKTDTKMNEMLKKLSIYNLQMVRMRTLMKRPKRLWMLIRLILPMSNLILNSEEHGNWFLKIPKGHASLSRRRTISITIQLITLRSKKESMPTKPRLSRVLKSSMLVVYPSHKQLHCQK
jgi:hypothetical protein